MVTFRKLSISDAELVLKWRTSDRVASQMFSKVENDLAKQKAWLQEVVLPKTPTTHWMIMMANTPVGLAYIEDINKCHASWGFYIGEMEKEHLGALIPIYFYNDVYETVSELESIGGHVLPSDQPILKIHREHGCLVTPLASDGEVEKKFHVTDLLSVTMTKNIWSKQRRWHGFSAQFRCRWCNIKPPTFLDAQYTSGK